MAKLPTPIIGLPETSAELLNFNKPDNKPHSLPPNLKPLQAGSMLSTRLFISLMLLRCSAWFASCAVKITPEMTGRI